jgi:hypothetical protein
MFSNCSAVFGCTSKIFPFEASRVAGANDDPAVSDFPTETKQSFWRRAIAANAEGRQKKADEFVREYSESLAQLDQCARDARKRRVF